MAQDKKEDRLIVRASRESLDRLAEEAAEEGKQISEFVRDGMGLTGAPTDCLVIIGYVLRGVTTGNFKVGVCQNIRSRISAYRGHSSEEIQILFLTQFTGRAEAQKWERTVLGSHKRLHGEWFAPTEETIVEIESGVFFGAKGIEVPSIRGCRPGDYGASAFIGDRGFLNFRLPSDLKAIIVEQSVTENCTVNSLIFGVLRKWFMSDLLDGESERGPMKKYENTIQMQLRLPHELKGKIQQQSQSSKVSVNQMLVEVLDREFSPKANAAIVAEGTTAPIQVASPWFWQLSTLKMLPKEAQGRMFMALIKASDSDVTLPAEFRDMNQIAKAAWLDENCPLGGE